jgi:hypothetical protein
MFYLAYLSENILAGLRMNILHPDIIFGLFSDLAYICLQSYSFVKARASHVLYDTDTEYQGYFR